MPGTIQQQPQPPNHQKPPPTLLAQNKTFGKYKGLEVPAPVAAPTKDSAATPSPAQLYEEACVEQGCKPNRIILDQLPKAPGAFTVRDINAASNYIGEKGLLALLPLVKANKNLTKIRLSNNGLKNGSVSKLLHLVGTEAPWVSSIDLSNNRELSMEVGTKCLKLAEKRSGLLHLSLSKTSVSKPLQDKIEAALKANRMAIGVRNKEALEQRVKVGRKELFDAKAVFDSLDKDGSGIVSLNELCKAEAGRRGEPSWGVDTSIFNRIDTDGDGEITFMEYLLSAFPNSNEEDLRFCIECYSEYVYPEYIPPPELSPEHLAEITEIFRAYDKSGDGLITKSELHESLSRSALCEDVDGCFADVDVSGDGKLNLPEFIELMKPYYVG